MPFEKFINYKAICVKILAKTYSSEIDNPIKYIQNAIKLFRNNENDSFEEKEIIDSLVNMRKNIKEIANWFDWRSKNEYKNPFTLIILELFYKKNNIKTAGNSLIARQEFYDLNISNEPVYFFDFYPEIK
jgi:hypothetical protein